MYCLDISTRSCNGAVRRKSKDHGFCVNSSAYPDRRPFNKISRKWK